MFALYVMADKHTLCVFFYFRKAKNKITKEIRTITASTRGQIRSWTDLPCIVTVSKP